MAAPGRADRSIVGAGRAASRARRALVVAAALVLPAVATLEVGGAIAIATRAVTPGAWDEVARSVEDLARGGALVVVAPRWAEPHLRQRLGDDVMPLAHLGRSDVSRFAAAVEVGLDGARAPELDGFAPVEERTIGPFVVRRLDNPAPEPVLYDLVAQLRPPHASVRGTDPAIGCPWSARARVTAGGLAGHPTLPRERFDCPGPPWMGVGVTVIADQGFLPRRCIWAHPFATGDKVLRWDAVPRTGARRLVGHHGMYWVVERDGRGADVHVEVRVDGVSLGEVVHRDGDGWAPFSFDLPDEAGAGATSTVEIAIRTADADRRHLCLEATLR